MSLYILLEVITPASWKDLLRFSGYVRLNNVGIASHATNLEMNHNPSHRKLDYHDVDVLDTVYTYSLYLHGCMTRFGLSLLTVPVVC